MTENRAKISEVVSVTTHQLKTPISIIKGYLEALLSEDAGEINKQQKEYLSDALENVKRMSLTVNHLLEVSRIEEGRYELKPERFRLDELTSEIIKDFSSWTISSNAKIVEDFSPNLPEINADKLKIRQVIENIISNALKYKNPGKGTIVVSIKKEGKKIKFSCKDDGIGISDEEMKKLFSKFYRSERAVEMDPSGTGLGLYINRSTIELSKGKIWPEKNKDKGVTIHFVLPIAK